MMKTAVSFATLVLVASVASADPAEGESRHFSVGRDGYIGLGGEVGDGQPGDDGGHAGLVLDGGLRLGATPLYVHGRVAHGFSGNADGGAYDQARMGVEARACSGGACAFLGLDGGYQHDHMVHDDFCIKGDNGGGCEGSKMDTVTDDVLVVPRAGFEFGNAVKFFLVLEKPVAFHMDQHEVGTSVTAGMKYSW